MQTGEEAEARAAAAAQAASLAQKDVQLQQLEVMKARIRADRCWSAVLFQVQCAACIYLSDI